MHNGWVSVTLPSLQQDIVGAWHESRRWGLRAATGAV